MEVPLDLIDLSDSAVKGPGDFGAKGVSYGDVRLGVLRLDEELMPAMRRGAGRGGEGDHGYGALYGAFFGDTCIKLSAYRKRILGDQRLPPPVRRP